MASPRGPSGTRRAQLGQSRRDAARRCPATGWCRSDREHQRELVRVRPCGSGRRVPRSLSGLRASGPVPRPAPRPDPDAVGEVGVRQPLEFCLAPMLCRRTQPPHHRPVRTFLLATAALGGALTPFLGTEAAQASKPRWPTPGPASSRCGASGSGSTARRALNRPDCSRSPTCEPPEGRRPGIRPDVPVERRGPEQGSFTVKWHRFAPVRLFLVPTDVSRRDSRGGQPTRSGPSPAALVDP